jgi:thiopurine S-methyltransferase
MVDHQHWLDRWKEDRIGFHEAQINRHLQTWFPKMAPAAGSGVFLPLCGKALDIQWCAQQGYEVLGIELSQIAIEAFFTENAIAFERSESECFVHYRAPNITLLQGDFFDLSIADLQHCQLVYDRAALIAMEGDNRLRYYDHMQSIVPERCDMLLISLEYDQAEMQGPPFSVPTDEIMNHYQKTFSIEQLESSSIIDERPRWRNVGLTALQESVFSLTRK